MKQDFSLIHQAITRQGVPAQVPVYEHGVDMPKALQKLDA
jgi:hypothetical protein